MTLAPRARPWRAWAVGRAIAIWLVLAAATNAATLRYLPEDPFKLTPGGIDYNYGGNLTNFDRDVYCGDALVGTIKFDYDTYGGLTGSGFTGGGALSGGFYYKPGYNVLPGYTLAWVQTVTATLSGINVWGAADGTEFPDTANKTDPAYPFQSVADLQPNVPNPDVGFQDFPNRFPNDGNQFWIAELGLVCLDYTNKTASVLSTFLWGFGITNANPGTIANITPNAPSLWSAPTPSYLGTLNNSFNGMNGSTKWTFGTGDCCIVPEPASLALSGTGLLIVVAFVRFRRQGRRAVAA